MSEDLETFTKFFFGGAGVVLSIVLLVVALILFLAGHGVVGFTFLSFAVTLFIIAKKKFAESIVPD